MAFKFRFDNPKSGGTLVLERVRCGKKNCYCSKRKRFHEGYYLYYRHYTEGKPGGKLKKEYVPKKKLWEYIMRIYLAKYHALKHRMSLHEEREILERIADAVDYYREKYAPETLQY